MLRYVTGFVPITDHPRSPEEYHALGGKLLETGVDPLRCFSEIQQCWLYRYLAATRVKVFPSSGDNPNKNTLAYHIVQHEKFDMLVTAAAHDGGRAFAYAWIDYGIMHVPGVTATVIQDLAVRAADEKAICIPGCWDKSDKVSDDSPCWRFCGGLIVVPRSLVYDLYAAVQKNVTKHVRETGRISWEVNTLARVELENELPIWWYKADHNETMFTNFPEVPQCGQLLSPGMSH